MSQLTLFNIEKPKPIRRRLMHVCDAGGCDEDGYDTMVRFECRWCQHETDWICMRTVTEAKRGLPCGKCNGLLVYRALEMDEAVGYSLAGGQALHLHRFVTPSSPLCFRKAVQRGERIAHLFDQDAERLTRTARGWGVRQIVIDKPRTDRQHVDLCGAPLKKALKSIGESEC